MRITINMGKPAPDDRLLLHLVPALVNAWVRVISLSNFVKPFERLGARSRVAFVFGGKMRSPSSQCWLASGSSVPYQPISPSSTGLDGDRKEEEPSSLLAGGVCLSEGWKKDFHGDVQGILGCQVRKIRGIALAVILLLAGTAPIVSAQQLQVRLVSLTSPVNPGDNATIVVQTTPGALCLITVRYKSGPSKAKDLVPKTADSRGIVTWTWRVGTRTTLGRWPIIVTCSADGRQGTLETSFEVRAGALPSPPGARSGPGASSGAQAGPQAACANPPQPANLQARVVRVIDGDTIQARLSNARTERVRLIGMDTPEVYESEKLERDSRESGRSREEIQALGRLASGFTKKHLDGKDVGLELDVQMRDRYGRLLAYVWLSDGTLFNFLILREGYAQVLTIPPNVKYTELFLACQREAREKRRGLWGRS